MTSAERPIGEFLLARGGPFYELQGRLGLLREDALRAPSRAVLFVGLAWGVPLVLSIIAGNALGPYDQLPFLLDPWPWSRFFIAVGLLVLMERHAEERLRLHLHQFTRAPLLAPASIEPAATVVWLADGPAMAGAPVLAYLCGYSYAKRFTKWSHFYLGSAIALSPVAAWVATRC